MTRILLVVILMLAPLCDLRAQSMQAIVADVHHAGGGGGGSTGAVTQVGTCNASGTTVVCTLSTPTAGHILVLSTEVYNCVAVTITMADNQSGNTYTKATTDAQTTGNNCTQFWTAPNINVSGTFIITLTSTLPDYLRMHVYDVNSNVTSSVVDANGRTTTNTSSASGTCCTTNALATTAANTVVFGNYSGLTTGVTATAGTGYTLGYSDQSLGTVIASLDEVYQIVTSAATYTPTVNWSTNEAMGYAAHAVAIKY